MFADSLPQQVRNYIANHQNPNLTKEVDFVLSNASVVFETATFLMNEKITRLKVCFKKV